MKTVSHLLWSRSRDLVLASAVHPFILSLLRGTLNEIAFKSYIAQDAFYLRSFKKAYARAAAICTTRNDEVGRGQFLRLEDGVDEELRLHKQYSDKLNINLDIVKPLPQTELYTEFLDQSGASHSVAYICASMAPCMSLYAFLGRRGIENGYKSGIYTRWVEEYSSVSFQQLAKCLEDLLDQYASEEGVEFDKLIIPYITAMEYELAFFSAHEVPSWNGVKPHLLCVDFDLTLTAKDTISVITKEALQLQNRDFSIFKTLEDQYFQKYQNIINKYILSSEPSSPISSSITETDSSPITSISQINSFDHDRFEAFISELSAFDKQMLDPVEESEILKGLTKEDINRLGSKIELLPGAKIWLNFITRRLPLHVITMNWSGQLVSATINEKKSLRFNGLTMPRITIFGNELEYDSQSSITTGNIIKSISNAKDKERCIQSLHAETGIDCASDPSVYIGDSLADLSALLAADIGIVMTPRPSFKKVCEGFGIQLEPLENIVQTPLRKRDSAPDQRRSKPILYIAESWAHVGFCLFGKHFYSDWIKLHRETIEGIPVESPTAERYFPMDPQFVGLPRVLSVAGSDSGGGAGIQADLKSCDALGVFGMTAITAITSQNTLAVTNVEQVDPGHIHSQLEAVIADIGVDAIKTGMLATETVAREVARAVITFRTPNLVVDPVMVTTSGTRLMSEESVEGIRKVLFPLALIITPNLEEVRALLKCEKIRTVRDMEVAAEKLFALGPAYVLVKGGHMVEQDSSSEEFVVDVLYDGHHFEHIRHRVISTSNTHGTGCSLASAIASYLAKGYDVPQAVRWARRYLQDILEASASIRLGGGKHGPMLHMSSVLPELATHLQSNPSEGLETSSRTGLAGSMWINHPESFSLRAYLVTDPSLNTRFGRSMETAVQAAVDGGASVIQLREKNISTSEFIALGKRILKITREAGIPMLINDRVDVALAVGADGVHLGQDDMSVRDARKLLGTRAIVGISVKTVEDAKLAEENGADYIGVGAVYPTSTKSDTKHIGLEQLRIISKSVSIPIVGIGGINLGEPVHEVLAHGASGVAVVSAVFGTNDVAEATRSLVQQINNFRLSK